jgi:hypothetical protein
MIDPQGQANRWIRNMEKEAGLDVVKPLDKDLLRSLENGEHSILQTAACLQNGFEMLYVSGTKGSRHKPEQSHRCAGMVFAKHLS